MIKESHRQECQPSEGGGLRRGVMGLLGPYQSEELLWELLVNKGVWVVLLQRRSGSYRRDNWFGPVAASASDNSSCLG